MLTGTEIAGLAIVFCIGLLVTSFAPVRSYAEFGGAVLMLSPVFLWLFTLVLEAYRAHG